MKPPIDILHLFPVLNRELIAFLQQLSSADWLRHTAARQWTVKDVAAHLLDGNFRRISLKRDGWSVPPEMPVASNDDLVRYLNQLNADWVKAAKRLSPQVLIELLTSTNETVYKLFTELDLFVPSAYPVSWAGQTMSYNWFDLAREYTERWLHQQQIRDACSDTGIMTKELYHPVLHIFMQAWPVAAKGVMAAGGTTLKTVVTGKGGGEWFLVRSEEQWRLSEQTGSNIAAETIIDGSVAWKLFSKSVRKEEIAGSFEIKGEKRLGEAILNMVSVMA